MPGFNGRFEYLDRGRGPAQEVAGRVSFDHERLTLVGPGAPLAFDLGDIDVFEPGEYELRLLLYTGQAVRLKQFGKAFQDLERQLLEAYRERLVKCLLVSDLHEVARFTGRVTLDGPRAVDGTAEVRLYESNLAVLPDAAAGFQWRLADIDALEFDEREYRVVVTRGTERLSIGRLAKRTGELAERLRDRITALGERSAGVLHALFPFLSPDQFRQVATTMREGGSASILDLREVHRLIEASLLEKVVDGALRPYLRALVERSAPDGWHAGFKIIRKDAEPAEQEDANAATSDGARPGEATEGAEEAPSAFTPAAEVTEVGDDLEVLYWFFVPIAEAGQAPSRLAWEATSKGGRATYLFRIAAAAPASPSSPGSSRTRVTDAVQAINRGLVALNFRREPVYLPSDTIESDVRYRHYAIAARKVPEVAVVRQSFVGRAIHRSLPSWRRQLDTLIAG